MKIFSNFCENISELYITYYSSDSVIKAVKPTLLAAGHLR